VHHTFSLKEYYKYQSIILSKINSFKDKFFQINQTKNFLNHVLKSVFVSIELLKRNANVIDENVTKYILCKDCRVCKEKNCKIYKKEDCRVCEEEDCEICKKEDCRVCKEENCKVCKQKNCKICREEDCKVCEEEKEC